MRGASTNCFYKRLFRLAGNERLKTQADQAQAHAHATGAMALDGLGLASGLIATGARLGYPVLDYNKYIQGWYK